MSLCDLATDTSAIKDDTKSKQSILLNNKMKSLGKDYSASTLKDRKKSD